MSKQGGAAKIYKNKIHLTDLDSCRRYMARVINLMDDGEISGSEARDRGYCIKIIADLISEGELESRIEELEELAQNKGRWSA